MEKTADYTGIDFRFFFVLSQLNYFVLKVVDLEPFNDTWQKKPDSKCMIQLDEHQKYLLFSCKIHGYYK
jgi:hypothetical protein